MLIIASSFALAIPTLLIIPQITDVIQILIILSTFFAFLGLGGSFYFAYSPVFISREIVGIASSFIDCFSYIVSFIGTLFIGLILNAGFSHDMVFMFLTIISLQIK